ncbi:uncharacterized protein LOC126847650, partial [Adelges cooleyi]|uniref:uncharacterized protein LOC126847650 n=1 Tax=Adelges cooleyi TaxID=133065 RepID=UPI002180364A
LLSAASSGDLDCLKYALKNGFPWTMDGKSGWKEASSGDLDCLKYAHNNGF